MKIINHLKRWNKWRKFNGNSKIYKFLVLIGFMKSPSFEVTWTNEEYEAVYKGLCEGLRGDKNANDD